MGVFFLLEDAIDWIQNEVAQVLQPFLGYFHLFPPHEPYMTRKEYVDIFDDGWKPEPKPVHAFPLSKSEEFLNLRRRHYDEYLAFVDAEFGRLLDFLRRTGILDNTYFILTSDHGQLFEREIHGHVTSTLYEPLIRVPLLISKPGQRLREDVTTPTSCVDLLPTLLSIAGKPVPDWCEGQILPSFGTSNPNSDRNIYAVEAKKNPRSAPLKMGTVSIINGRYKLIRYFGYQAKMDDYELYDLQNDPGEYEDLYQSRKRMASELKGELIARIDDANRKITEGEV
jgi:arylsulfatase A-like enzyme